VPLVVRVVRAAQEAVAEVVVVTKGAHAPPLRTVLPQGVALRTDARKIQSPLVGFVAGADALASEYVAFLPCDLPLLSPALLAALFDAAAGHDAAIPRWPDGRIEPMVAVYLRTPARDAALEALEAGDRANTDLIRRLLDVVYIPVEKLRAVDPALDSFVNVNTPADLKAVERRLRSRR
jgi:molybdopterin-guanine dinucleotide biosynthesis protein A